ncbi:MAG: alpha/beta fold hydrolase [Pseudomonadota bacterium]
MLIRGIALLIFLMCTACALQTQRTSSSNSATIESLEQLSIASLRNRSYGSELVLLNRESRRDYPSYLASYESDGLRLYTRIDVPRKLPPKTGYPVVVFVHGYRGIETAASLDFYYEEDSYYYQLIEAYVAAGFVVMTPGLRGHGTVNNVPADGLEFLAAWDGGSYLCPIFYAVDVLNLLESLSSFDKAPLDQKRINLMGHSQGGDTVLTVLAVVGEDSTVNTQINGASIWSGTFAPRIEQLMSYHPMQTSAEAFLSGDGTWNGTAKSDDGRINKHFVFGYPPEWIEDPRPENWTWQKDTWRKTFREAAQSKLDDMYDSINEHVADLTDATFNLRSSVDIQHDPRLLRAFEQIDAIRYPHLLTEPLVLQYSDRDFYSPPSWNIDLCQTLVSAGNLCEHHLYPQNTHLLGVSQYQWFSDQDAQPGFEIAIQRDVQFFSATQQTKN